MSRYENIFTDAIKDVIGNDPVIDQFDNYYVNSFYGSSQDDYVTGSLLSIETVGPTKRYITGSRGSAFSKLYASSQPPLDSTYGSDAVGKIPSLAFRQQPWSEKISVTSLRNIQCFDTNERYYDSCLPDLKKCFNSNESRVWAADEKTTLSPYGNIDTNANGFIIFNSVLSDRSAEGYTKDPTVNNEWTWSYPYENKYFPNNRTVRTTSTLGINFTDLKVDWNVTLGSSSYFKEWDINLDNITELGDKPLKLEGIIPVLPGKLESSIISPAGGRNSLRGTFFGNASYSAKAIYGVDSSLNDVSGVSFLIPSDVNLGQYADHSFLGALTPSVADPGNELLTGSMSTDDLIKFFFGFGDLNNMTYSQYDYSLVSGSYEEEFEQSGLVSYYFSGPAGSAEATRRQSDDRSLIRSNPGTTETFTRTSSEVGPTGWVDLTGISSPAVSWITNNSDPGSTTISAGTWSFYLNCQGSSSKIRAQIYSWNGSTATLLGTTEEKDLSVSMTLLKIDWTISSPITLLITNRILVVVQGYLALPSSGCYATFKNRHDYLPLGMLRRYSSISTNVPVTYDPGIFYTEAKNLSVYSQGNLSVDWSKSPSTKPWKTIYRSGSTTIGTEDYNYWGPGPLSGTFSPNKRGLFGLASKNNNFILYSSGSYDVMQQEYSICCMDITSSNPWTISYDRAVAGKEDFFLTSYISGYPGKPSHQLSGGPFEEIEVLEVVTGSNNDLVTSSPTKKYYHDYFLTFDSGLQHGGTATAPSTFPPGEWRVNFKLDWQEITSSPDNEFVMAGLDNISIKTYSMAGNPSGPKIGGNNYPTFRTYRVDPRVNETISEGTTLNKLATKALHEANIFGVSPTIRGWKYGLYSGLPTNSKSVFRRNRFGQFRDMLEQRQYTKFIGVEDSPVDDDAVTSRGFNKFTQSRYTRNLKINTLGSSPVEVNFLKQRYKKNDRGIGYIFNESVSPELTTSQNFSTEVTSSLPYFDGEAKTRQESSYALIKDATLTSIQIDTSGLTVT